MFLAVVAADPFKKLGVGEITGWVIDQYHHMKVVGHDIEIDDFDPTELGLMADEPAHMLLFLEPQKESSADNPGGAVVDCGPELTNSTCFTHGYLTFPVKRKRDEPFLMEETMPLYPSTGQVLK